MEVELPSTGCNIINSSSSFYNYSIDRTVRELYYIIDGKAYKQNSTTNAMGYSYTGTCLHTGDIIYKPEIQIYFPLIAFILVYAAIMLAYRIVIWRFIK